MTLQDKLKALAEGKKIKITASGTDLYTIVWIDGINIKKHLNGNKTMDADMNEVFLMFVDTSLSCEIVEFEDPLPSSGMLSFRYSVYSDKYEIVSKNREDLIVYTIAFFDIGKESIDVRLVYGRFLEENRDDFIKVLYESQIYLQKKFFGSNMSIVKKHT